MREPPQKENRQGGRGGGTRGKTITQEVFFFYDTKY